MYRAAGLLGHFHKGYLYFTAAEIRVRIAYQRSLLWEQIEVFLFVPFIPLFNLHSLIKLQFYPTVYPYGMSISLSFFSA